MSYVVKFMVNVNGIDKWVNTGYAYGEMLWDVKEIITHSTGLEWVYGANNGLCCEIIPKIVTGIMELSFNRSFYKKYEPDNGEGSIESTLYFLYEILQYYMDMVCKVPDLAKEATFWICEEH